jgi:hypothetical protein
MLLPDRHLYVICITKHERLLTLRYRISSKLAAAAPDI